MAFRPCFTTSLAQQTIVKISLYSNCRSIYDKRLNKSLMVFLSKYYSKENRRSQSKFVCTSCGYTSNADINASKNILVRGIHGNNASLKIAV